MASWCALRFGETVELRRGDIDLSLEVIRVQRAAVRTKGTYSVTTPKSDAETRDVDIPPHIIPPIDDHLAKHVGTARNSLLFPTRRGSTCNPPRCTAIGIERVGWRVEMTCGGRTYGIRRWC